MRRRNFLQLIGIVAIPNAIQAAEFGSSPVRQEKFQQRYRAYHEEGVQRLCDLNGAYPLGIDMTPGGVNYASCDFHFVMPDLPRNTTKKEYKAISRWLRQTRRHIIGELQIA